MSLLPALCTFANWFVLVPIAIVLADPVCTPNSLIAFVAVVVCPWIRTIICHVYTAVCWGIKLMAFDCWNKKRSFCYSISTQLNMVFAYVYTLVPLCPSIHCTDTLCMHLQLVYSLCCSSSEHVSQDSSCSHLRLHKLACQGHGMLFLYYKINK